MTINQYEQYIQEQGWDDRFRYMLLDRMRSDCDYFLGNGQIYGNHLWAENVTDQIGYMKALWNSFPEDGKFICDFGFREAGGSFSDISVVAPHLDVAAVNISAGYYNEHRQHEYVRLDQMEENISRVREIVLTSTERFAYRGLYSSPSTGGFWGKEKPGGSPARRSGG